MTFGSRELMQDPLPWLTLLNVTRKPTAGLEPFGSLAACGQRQLQGLLLLLRSFNVCHLSYIILPLLPRSWIWMLCDSWSLPWAVIHPMILGGKLNSLPNFQKIVNCGHDSTSSAVYNFTLLVSALSLRHRLALNSIGRWRWSWTVEFPTSLSKC